MKRVVVRKGKVNVLKRNGDFLRAMLPGKYWVRLGDSIVEYKMDVIYGCDEIYDVLSGDADFDAIATSVLVSEGQLALVYNHGILESVLRTGSYVYFKGLNKIAVEVIDFSTSSEQVGSRLGQYAGQALLSPFVRKFTVLNNQLGVLMVNGEYRETLTAGTYFYWNNDQAIEVMPVDTRQKQMELAGQEMLTKDKAALRINFYAQYSVEDPQLAMIANENYEKQLYISIQLALRAFVGAVELDELLDNKAKISAEVIENVRAEAARLGVALNHCGIRDIILPGEMREIMNSVLIAQKRAQANTIARREETASTRTMLNSAKLMEENQMLFKLKEMEYIERIADKVGAITISGGGQVLKEMKGLFGDSK